MMATIANFILEVIGGAMLAGLFVVFYALGVSVGREASQNKLQDDDTSMEHRHGGEDD